MIAIQIDVNKINKEKLYKGEKGTYLNLVLIPTPNSQYSDYMVVESTTKEEREQGVKGEMLGNAKNLQKSEQSQEASTGEVKTGLPF